MRVEEQDIFRTLSRRARLGALVSTIGVVLAFGAIVYAGLKLYRLNTEIEGKGRELLRLEERVSNLEAAESDVLDFLSEVMSREEIERFDPTIDWPWVKAQILDLPAGKQKKAVLLSLLYAWKDVPFRMGGNDLTAGFDSPRFIRRVLADVGLTVETQPGVRLSDSLMDIAEPTTAPEPGDLVFFKGIVGSFGFILLAPPDATHSAVGVGTLQKIAPLQVISMANINTRDFPMIGYFRVPYPDRVTQR